MITIKEIIDGAKNVEKVHLKTINEDILLRPLTQSEIGEIEKIEASALGTFTTEEKTLRGQRQQKGEATSTAKINIVKQTEASNKAKLTAVALSTSTEDITYSMEDIAKLPNNVFKEIYEHVQRINNLGDDVNVDLEKEVEAFP